MGDHVISVNMSCDICIMGDCVCIVKTVRMYYKYLYIFSSYTYRLFSIYLLLTNVPHNSKDIPEFPVSP